MTEPNELLSKAADLLMHYRDRGNGEFGRVEQETLDERLPAVREAVGAFADTMPAAEPWQVVAVLLRAAQGKASPTWIGDLVKEHRAPKPTPYTGPGKDVLLMFGDGARDNVADWNPLRNRIYR